MARIRSIKPEFFIDEDIGNLPPLTRLLFVGMWCEADKAGRLKDKPKTLKARCLPFDSVDINKALDQLADSRFIIRYMVGGEQYIQIRTWDEHQRPHHTERASVYPESVNGDLTVNSPLQDGEKKVTRNREPSLPFLSLPFPSSLGESEFRPVWEKWVKHRVQIKKPLKEAQATEQIRQFGEWGTARSIAAINHTVRQGWQGLREPENGQPATKTTQDKIREMLERARPKEERNGQLG